MSSSERLSHDQAVKQLLADYPLEALRFFAGDEGRRLGPDVRITHLRQEQVSLRLEKGFREVDSLILVEAPGTETEHSSFSWRRKPLRRVPLPGRSRNTFCSSPSGSNVSATSPRLSRS